MRTLGIVAIIVGILMIVFTSINFQTKKKVLDVGKVEISKTENHRVGWPVYTGIAVCVVGVVVLLVNKRAA
jgi:uncharacterized membrane protein YidH (DUF202 family)